MNRSFSRQKFQISNFKFANGTTTKFFALEASPEELWTHTHANSSKQIWPGCATKQAFPSSCNQKSSSTNRGLPDNSTGNSMQISRPVQCSPDQRSGTNSNSLHAAVATTIGFGFGSLIYF